MALRMLPSGSNPRLRDLVLVEGVIVIHRDVYSRAVWVS